jgi:CheY-like chemotaxis protein
MDPVRPRVLVVDDDEIVAETVRRALARSYDVTIALSGEAALRCAAATPFDAILCDLAMPGMSGMEFCAALARTSPALAERVVLTTGGAYTPQAEAFLDAAPNPRLDKPFTAVELRAAVAAATANAVAPASA